jgi:hypothetical protein
MKISLLDVTPRASCSTSFVRHQGKEVQEERVLVAKDEGITIL